MDTGLPDNTPAPKGRRRPSGPGLPAAGETTPPAVTRRRRAHPAKRKPLLEKTQDIIKAAEAVLAGTPVQKAAIEAGVDVTGKSVKELVKQARERFLSRVNDYVDIHIEAARVAAADGDAKPAQWALERIAAEGERVVELVADPRAMPSPMQGGINIGVMVGGIPAPPATQTLDTAIVDADALPPLEPTPPEELMP